MLEIEASTELSQLSAFLEHFMQPHVFLATPCYGGLVTQGYMQSVCALMAAAPSSGLELTLALLGQDALITRCRNTLVSHFISNPVATHILFIDADISFEPGHVFRLLQARKSIVAGMYPLKGYYWDHAYAMRLAAGEPAATAGLHYVGELKPKEQIIQDGYLATATFAGTGFMLIAREAIEQLIIAHPETRYRSIDAMRSGAQALPEAFALFDCMIDPDTGVYMSEDFTFCRRWRELGNEIWLDTSVNLTHTGPSDFQGVPLRRYSDYLPI